MKGHNDVSATQEKTYLKWYNKIGYGSGDVGGNVVYAFLSAFVMIYLTDAVGLNPGIIGTLIMVSRLFDGVSDLFFGNLIDRTHTKMGKARPWMFWAYFGCAATLIATFAIPTNVGQTAQYAWFFIAYTLLNAVFFTANNIAFSALTALITKNGAERVQMGSIRFMFAFGTSMLIQTFTVAGVQQFGGGAEGWRTIAIIYAVIGLAVNSLSVFSVRELSREELADRPGAHHDPAELAEVEVLQRYLPAALSDEELDAIVTSALAAAAAELGAAPTLRQMGQVIKAVNAEVAGRAEGAQVAAKVKAALA